MIELDAETMKILAPLITWGSWVTRSIYKSQKDADMMFYIMRGKVGKRDRSITGRLRRLKNWRKNGNNSNRDSQPRGKPTKEAGNGEVSKSDRGAGSKDA